MIGEPGHPDPPSCSISVSASPDAVPLLCYAVPVVGVVKPFTTFTKPQNLLPQIVE